MVLTWWRRQVVLSLELVVVMETRRTNGCEGFDALCDEANVFEHDVEVVMIDFVCFVCFCGHNTNSKWTNFYPSPLQFLRFYVKQAKNSRYTEQAPEPVEQPVEQPVQQAVEQVVQEAVEQEVALKTSSNRKDWRERQCC